MIESAVAAIQRGEVVGLPTDTVYGVGADPFNPDAVDRLFEIKGRPTGKPIGLLVASSQQAAKVAVIEEEARALADAHWPGALTLVVRPRVVLADWVGDRQTETLGIRVPDHPVAIGLLEATGPLAVTSANLAGGSEAMDHQQAIQVFGAEVSVYLQGHAPGGEASTVVDVTGPVPVVLRQGPVHI